MSKLIWNVLAASSEIQVRLAVAICEACAKRCTWCYSAVKINDETEKKI